MGGSARGGRMAVAAWTLELALDQEKVATFSMPPPPALLQWLCDQPAAMATVVRTMAADGRYVGDGGVSDAESDPDEDDEAEDDKAAKKSAKRAKKEALKTPEKSAEEATPSKEKVSYCSYCNITHATKSLPDVSITHLVPLSGCIALQSSKKSSN